MGGAPEPVWTRWWREKFPAPAGTRIPGDSSRSPALYHWANPVTPCSYVIWYQRFGGPCRFHLQGEVIWDGGNMALRNVGNTPHHCKAFITKKNPTWSSSPWKFQVSPLWRVQFNTKQFRNEPLVYDSCDNSVGIALGYGLDDRCSRVRFPGGGWEFFSSLPRPEWLWGPPSLLSNGY
jgi:hypothetical protein